MKPETERPNFSSILTEALTKPGQMMEAYRAFNAYSFGNILWVMAQCHSKGLKIGPVATFKAWQSKGRSVKKGSKALSMLVPVSFSKESKTETGETETQTMTFFKPKRAWFVLDQTESENDSTVESINIPSFDPEVMLSNLNIKRIEFEHSNGNIQGYAIHGKREIAVNPLAQLTFKTLIHETAHIELGHTDPSLHDDYTVPKQIKEVEAESVALLVIESLGQPGAEFCRGYIQNWIGSNKIDEPTAKRIMACADRILKAGSKIEV